MNLFTQKATRIFIVSLFLFGLGNSASTAKNKEELPNYKETDNSTTNSSQRDLEDALKLTITGNSYSDETIIRFLAGATIGLDSNYDAWKFFSPNQQVPSLYTKLNTGDPLSINALPHLDKDWTIDIFAVINVTGNYLIETEELGLFSPTTELYLEDLITGTFYNLSTISSFTINVSSPISGNAPIFKLQVALPAQAIATNITCYGANNGQVMVLKAGNHSFNYTLQNSMGTVLGTGTNINETDTLQGLAAGNYVIEYTGISGNPLYSNFSITEPQQIQSLIQTLSDTIYLSEGGIISFTNNSINATTYNWSFGDGTPDSPNFEPVHTYNNTGVFTVTLNAINGVCSSIETRDITVEYSPVITDIKQNLLADKIEISKQGKTIFISVTFQEAQKMSITVHNLLGQQIHSSNYSNVGQKNIALNLEQYAGNYYIVGIQTENEFLSKKLFIP